MDALLADLQVVCSQLLPVLGAVAAPTVKLLKKRSKNYASF